MANQFEGLSSLPGVNRFSGLVPETQNRFANLGTGTANTTPQVAQSTTGGFGGAVGALGHILSLGQQTVTGLATKALEKTGVLESKTAGLGIKQAIQENQSNTDLLKRIGEEKKPGGLGGVLTGNYTPSTSVFGNFTRELPVTVAGTVADIFLDPLTYAGGLGIVKRATTGIGQAVKQGSKAVAAEVPAIQKMGDMLGKWFLTRYGQTAEFKTLDQARLIQESLVKDNVSKIVAPIIDLPAAIQQRVTQAIKGADLSDAQIRQLAQPVREELDRLGESISKLNPKLLSEETFQANKGTYFPRLYTDYEFPKGEEGLINQVFGSRATSIPKEPFKGRTLTEAESIAKGTRIEEAGLPALKRLTQLGITEVRQNFFQQVGKLASTEPVPGWIQLSSDKSLGDLAGKFLPAADYKAITDIRHVPSEYERIYNAALSQWKTFKTAYNPATISRNDLTNYFILNPLGGVAPWNIANYARTTSELVGKGPLYQLARQNGLEISTQQAAELTAKANTLYTENKGVIGQFFSNFGKFNETVKNFYGSQDKFFKLSNFIQGVTKDGLTPDEAMKRANFYLVDYSEVPEFVKWARKSPVGIPFISFAYGVSKPLAKTLLERPDKLSNYFKILRNIQEMNPLGESPAERAREQDVLPEWISNGTYLRLPVQDTYGRSQYVDLQYILPFNVLETKSITPSNPVFNTLASIVTNKDPFTGKEIVATTDTQLEKVEKFAANFIAQIVPSWTPFVGTSFNKVMAALQHRPDRNGFIKTKLETALDVLGGIKITPIDTTVEAQKRAGEKRTELKALQTKLRSILLDKSLFPEERQEQVQVIRQKTQTAAGILQP